MPLIPVTRKLAPSSNPYAFRLDSAEYETLTRHDGVVIDPSQIIFDAIWLGRKNGVTTVTIGRYTVWTHGQDRLSRDDDLTTLLSKTDTRYGGSWTAKFDGDVLLMEPTHILPIPEQVALVEQLRGVLDDPEHLPAGWSGWYRKASLTPP